MLHLAFECLRTPLRKRLRCNREKKHAVYEHIPQERYMNASRISNSSDQIRSVLASLNTLRLLVDICFSYCPQTRHGSSHPLCRPDHIGSGGSKCPSRPCGGRRSCREGRIHETCTSGCSGMCAYTPSAGPLSDSTGPSSRASQQSTRKARRKRHCFVACSPRLLRLQHLPCFQQGLHARRRRNEALRG